MAFLHLDNTPHDEIVQQFHKDGFVCLNQVFSNDLIEEWFQWSTNIHIPRIFETLHSKGCTNFPEPQRVVTTNDSTTTTTTKSNSTIEYAMKGCGVKHGYREIVMRSPGRYEISVRDAPDHPSSLQEISSMLEPLMSLLLPSEDSSTDTAALQLCHVSIVVASPGATDQGWHADGGHVNLQKHLDCHVLNVFIPLVHHTPLLGPTEVRPGSHYLTRNLVPLLLAAKARKTLQPPVLPLLQRGDIMMFDYRTLHRGRANCSVNQDRPILVLTYAKPWFKDVCNFPKRSVFD